MAKSDSAPMAQLEIHTGMASEHSIGGLRFVAYRRDVGDFDGGISLYVWAALPDEDRELLRFDLFRGRPHYHAPAESEAGTPIELASHADCVGWCVEVLTTRVGEFLVRAGHAQIADRLDGAALAEAAPELNAILASLPEPTETESFEVPQSLIDTLAVG